MCLMCFLHDTVGYVYVQYPVVERDIIIKANGCCHSTEHCCEEIVNVFLNKTTIFVMLYSVLLTVGLE